jgi:hypothetical protein
MLMGQERRALPRKVLKAPARIRNGFYTEAFNCLVMDVSPAGARVNAEGLALPNSFTLVLDSHGSTTRLCSVMWRDAYTVGVKFIPRPELAA